MKAKLSGGQEVPVFSDFSEAEQAGMLSKTAWRRQGWKVHKDSVPAGIVINQQLLIHKQDKVAVPILDDQGEFLVIALKWCDVFDKSQAVKQNKPKVFQEAVNSALLQLQQEEKEGGEGWKGSLMTPKVLEMPISDGVSSNSEKSRKGTVNSVRAYVPEGLDLPDQCPVKEQIYWLLGLIYWKHLERRLPWDDPINLKYDYLKANIPNWPEVWRWCDGLGLVNRDGYTPGEKSYGYRTALPYREQTHLLRTFEHAGLVKRLRAIERMHSSRPILVHLRKQLDRLSVDMDEFNARFITSPNQHYYRAHLQTILDGELRLTADGFSGRFHSNISNMFKPLRALLRVDGEPDTLGETDIKNSQPLFLALAAKEQGVEDRKYLQLCEDGLLYEHIAGRLGVLRESAKHEIVKFFYAKNGLRSIAKSVFEREFPEMAAFIHQVKKKDHKRLSRQMQIAERRFVIDIVCTRLKRLQPEMFMTTIHDAVLARKTDCDLVLTVMKEEFGRRGINPRLEWQDVKVNETDGEWAPEPDRRVGNNKE